MAGQSASWTPNPTSPLALAVYKAGFTYSPDQDIICSRTDAWQKDFGYTYLYDHLAPVTISAVIHSEPIFFSYGGKDWLIELWKGQYGIETGAEIGLYSRSRTPSLGQQARYAAFEAFPKWPSDPKQPIYFDCATDSQLMMSFALFKSGSLLFQRGPEEHWWLTGFRWGVCSKPTDLTMKCTILFPDGAMADGFMAALTKLGYQPQKSENGVKVDFEFGAQPKNPQPKNDATRSDAWQRDIGLVKAYPKGLPNNDPNTVSYAAARQYFEKISSANLTNEATAELRRTSSLGTALDSLLKTAFS